MAAWPKWRVSLDDARRESPFHVILTAATHKIPNEVGTGPGGPPFLHAASEHHRRATWCETTVEDRRPARRRFCGAPKCVDMNGMRVNPRRRRTAAWVAPIPQLHSGRPGRERVLIGSIRGFSISISLNAPLGGPSRAPKFSPAPRFLYFCPSAPALQGVNSDRSFRPRFGWRPRPAKRMAEAGLHDPESDRWLSPLTNFYTPG